jgi:hypothetical protein
VAKVLVYVTPWIFSVALTDAAHAQRAERPSTQRQSMRPNHAAHRDPCEPGVCPLPPRTVERIVRFSYVPEIIRTADDM